VTDYESTVERLRLLRESDDESRWAAGDWVLEFLGLPLSERTDGVAKALPELLASLAADSGFGRAGLRERYHCSAFWPKETRGWNTVVTWSHFNRARRGFDFETACDLMERAEQRGWSVAQFERFCQRYKSLLGADTRRPVDGAALLERAATLLRRLLSLRGVPERYRRRLRAALDALE